jgi:hypothetical protein
MIRTCYELEKLLKLVHMANSLYSHGFSCIFEQYIYFLLECIYIKKRAFASNRMDKLCVDSIPPL